MLLIYYYAFLLIRVADSDPDPDPVLVSPGPYPFQPNVKINYAFPEDFHELSKILKIMTPMTLR